MNNTSINEGLQGVLYSMQTIWNRFEDAKLTVPEMFYTH